MRKLFTRLLLVIIALLCAVGAQAYDFEVDDIYYNVVSFPDLTCEVTYVDFASPGTYSGEITVPSTVTYNGRTLDVVAVGQYAFMNSINLTNVILPESIKTIKETGFMNCIGLKSINLPSNLESIDHSAFAGCEGLSSIEIPSTLEEIAETAFNMCYSLSKLTIPQNIKSIGNLAFGYCGIKELIIEDSDDELELYEGTNSSAFYQCKVEHLYVGRDLTSWKALCNSSELLDVEFGPYVTEIGEEAFRGCAGLSNLFIPKNINKIYTYAFTNCHGVKILHIEDGEEVLKFNTSITHLNFFGGCEIEEFYLGRNLEWGDAFTLNSYLKEAVIGDMVTNIPSQLFSDCTGLETLTIGTSVQTIKKAFTGCTALSNLMVKTKVPPTFPEDPDFPSTAYLNCKVYVPIGTAATYMISEYWQNFWTILEKDFNASLNDVKLEETIKFDGSNILNPCGQILYVYDTMGKLIYNGEATTITLNSKGMYIIHSNQKTFKVIAK